MKRQADGIRLSDDIEQTEENGNKRIKLLNNEINKENFQVEQDKSMMDATSCENSHDHNYEDEGPSISNNVSPKKHDASPKKHDASPKKYENHSIQSAHENESIYTDLNEVNNCNGSYDEAVVEASTSDSGIVSELYYMPSLENSVQYSEESPLCDDKKVEPPSLKHCDHDLLNNKSVDSFQSEVLDAQNIRSNSENGFEKHKDNSNCEVNVKHTSKSSCEVSMKHVTESNCEISEEINQEASTKSNDETNYEIQGKPTSQVQDNNSEKEFSLESNVKKSIDVDNLTLSQLKVTELLGHTEEVLAVAADEDFILSSSADTTTKAWNMERQNVISTFSGHSNSVTSVLLLTPNQSKKIKKKMSLTKVSRIAITGSLDCHIKLWSVLEGKELASVYTFNGITCLGYLESDCLVVVGTEGGKLELWNLSSKKAVVSERAHEDKVTDIKVIDNYIYSVSVDGAVKVWSYEDEDLFPVYSRKRKEISSDKSGFKPAQWEAVAVFDNVLYLGDCTSSIKMLDWRAGRLSLFKNHIKKQAVCSCIVTEENILFSSCYDSFNETSGINVWKLPEMTYVCTLSGAFPKINDLAVAQKNNKLKVVTGGDKLFLCEFDFSKPPSCEGEFFVCENEMLGHEINENPVEIKKAENNASNASRSEENHSSSNRWCNVM